MRDYIEISKEEYEELKYKILELRKENERLEKRLDLALSLKETAEFRIRNELEPRIKRENRAYDNWVSTPREVEE